MKKILTVLGILLIIGLLFGSGGSINTTYTHRATKTPRVRETATPKPTVFIPMSDDGAVTFIPGWYEMTFEERVKYYNDISLEEAMLSFSPDNKESNLTEYANFLYKSLIKEARDKYDEAYIRKRSKGGSGNPEYYLFDFDNNEFMILYKSQYGRHYGTYIELSKGVYQIQENDDPFIDPYLVSLKNGKMYIGTSTSNGFAKCDIEEPLKYILNRST